MAVNIKAPKPITPKFCARCGQACVYSTRVARYDDQTGAPRIYTDEQCPKVAKWYGFVFKDNHHDETYDDDGDRISSYHW